MTLEQEVNYLKEASTKALCQYLATKVRQRRKQNKESQATFALRAGIPLRTFKRLETHGQGHLETFIKALKALEYEQYLHLLFPPAVVPGRRTLQDYVAQVQSKQPAHTKPANQP
jgi:transcriptional regulator with XRE-family HTH domain